MEKKTLFRRKYIHFLYIFFSLTCAKPKLYICFISQNLIKKYGDDDALSSIVEIKYDEKKWFFHFFSEFLLIVQFKRPTPI